MANGASIPPWISRIDPIAPVPMFLQGYGQGASVGTSRRVGEQQAAEFAQRQAFLQAQAALENELRREIADQRAAEFTANLRIEQQKAERESANAAEQALAMRQYKADIQAGMSEAQAAARNPAIFGTSRGGLGSVISAIERANRTQQGQGFWVPAGGFAAPGDVPFSFQGDPSELVGLTNVPAHRLRPSGQVQFPPQPRSTEPKEGELTEVETARLRVLQKDLDKVTTILSDPIRSAIAENTKKGKLQELQKERTDIQSKIDAILNKNQPVAPTDHQTINTKSEFDALPSGTIFRGTDGKLYRKK
jgi:hypothetical protein